MLHPRRTLLPLLLALGLGLTLGRFGLPEPTAHAETRPSPPREAFKSGAARSESLLTEIAATLKRIDARVARIEAKLPEAE